MWIIFSGLIFSLFVFVLTLPQLVRPGGKTINNESNNVGIRHAQAYTR